MASRSTARTKKASSAKAPAKTARTAKSAKPEARARAKTAARAKPAPAKRTARAPASKAPAAKAPARRPAATRGGNSALDKLQQVALTATNLDASIGFYRDTLGLRFITRFDPPGLAFFSLGGGVRLLLSATASQASLYFQVDNVDGAVKVLRDRGVRFLQQPQLIQRDEAGDFGKKGTEEWMAFFNDPAGNLLALVERR